VPSNFSAEKLDEGLKSTGLLVAGASMMFARWANGFQKHANQLPLFDQVFPAVFQPCLLCARGLRSDAMLQPFLHAVIVVCTPPAVRRCLVHLDVWPTRDAKCCTSGRQPQTTLVVTPTFDTTTLTGTWAPTRRW